MGKVSSRDEWPNAGGRLSVRVPVVCLGLLLAFAPAAKAHRVEGYLQATLLGLTQDRVELEVNVTPGLEKFSEALAFLDHNNDGEISTLEWQLYAARVVEDLNLEFDYRRQPLVLARSSFPPLDDMRAGVGTITLKLIAVLPQIEGRHHLYFRNRHLTGASDYLLNCLQPPHGIEITRQVRDYRQTEINLDFSVPSTAEPSSFTMGRVPRWMLAPGLLLFLNLVRVWRLIGMAGPA